MSEQVLIDIQEFASTGQKLRGRLAIESLTRLQDRLVDAEGAIDFELRGGRDQEQHLILQIGASGTLHLQCQRCLGALVYPVALSNTLLLIGPGEDPGRYAENPDAPDFVEANPRFDVRMLVEDEILLSLPMAPRHERDCAGNSAQRQEALPSAFAQLGELRHTKPKR